MNHICEYCDNEFSSLSALNYHKNTAKYCLEKQGKDTENIKCSFCSKEILKTSLKKHLEKCKLKNNDLLSTNELLNEKINELEKTLIHKNIDNEFLKKQITKKDKEIFELKLEISKLIGKNEAYEKIKQNEKCKRKEEPEYVCEHNKRKTLCKDCGGSELCKTPFCEVRKNRKYENYCLRCYIYTFPDKQVVRNYKTKEKSVVDYVFSIFHPEKFSWVTDKKIQDGCSSKRPDLLLDLGYMVIVIEIDENQHRNYDTTCENTRLMTISKDLNHRPMVFIRFNPDSYKVLNKTVSSCWTTNKNGICVVNKSKEKEWIERLKTLCDKIEYYIKPENKIGKTVELINLYFDVDDDEENEVLI